MEGEQRRRAWVGPLQRPGIKADALESRPTPRHASGIGPAKQWVAGGGDV